MKKKAKPAAKKPAPKKSPPVAKPALRHHARPSLGRGLGALLGAPAAQRTQNTEQGTPNSESIPHSEFLVRNSEFKTSSPTQSILKLPVGEITRSPWQPRLDFDPERLAELAASIKTHGVLQPILCRRIVTGGYELIAGERRLRAAIVAGLTHIPAVLVEDTSDRNAAEIAVIENIQRADLNIIEEAEGFKTLAEKFNMTHQEIADRVGKPRPSISNTLRLLDLTDEAKQLLATGRLSTGHAKVLLAVESPTEQTLLARKCVTDSLTVRMTERLLSQRQKEAAPKRAPESDLPETYVKDLTDRLHQHFGTSVRLLPGVTYANGEHAKGSIQIDFFNNEELERILEMLGVELG